MKEDKTKEIDLLDLLSNISKSIGNFLKSLYDAFWWLIVFGIKNYIYLILFAGIGAGLGIYHVSTAEKGYRSEMTIRTNAMRSYEMVDFFEEISSYFSQKDEEFYPVLEKKFNLDSTSISKIRSITPHFYIDFWSDGTMDEIDYKNNHSSKDTINIRDSLHLCIRATVSDPMVFTQIGNSIKNYIDNHPFIIDANNYRLGQLAEDVLLMDTELKYLDSLQRVSYFNGANNMAQLQMSNTRGFVLGENRQQLYHRDKELIQEKKKLKQKALNLYYEPTTIIKDFPIVTTEVESNYIQIIKYIIIFGAIGYILLLLIYFFKTNYSKYSDKV